MRAYRAIELSVLSSMVSLVYVIYSDDFLQKPNLLYFLCCCFLFRVCKSWYSILRNKSAWSHIDFTEKGPVQQRLTSGRRRIPYTIQWRFPTNEDDILEFLTLYGGGSLRQIRLASVTGNIMLFLHENCPKLRSLSLAGGKSGDFIVKKTDVKDVLRFPPGVVNCKIECPAMPESYSHHELWSMRPIRDEEILRHLAQQRTLKYLSLHGFYLSQELGMESLAKKNVSLQGIHIINPFVFSDQYGYMELLDVIMTSSIGKLLTLECLKIECSPISRRYISTLRTLPACIANYKNLKVLSLKGVDCSSEAFTTMLTGLMNLESLQLEGHCITTTTVTLIGQNLKKLEVLELANGSYSDESFQTLSHHPALLKLWMYKGYAHRSDVQPSWVRSIFDIVLPTLSKIRFAKIEGYQLSAILGFNQNDYPSLASVKIEINDVPEELLCD